MPRDYKHIARKKAEPKISFHRASFATGLVIGLVIALTVYLTEDLPSLSAFIIEQAGDSEPVAMEVPVAKETLPEPTFDFYRILPNMEVNVSEYETGEETPVISDSEEVPSAYILQVGSFKKFE
ncbi:MAG: hypothetical protein MI673_02060, partial [Thiotrichales bacterium]|nr:hypothetical protein [Thiotrichales bacterium]